MFLRESFYITYRTSDSETGQKSAGYELNRRRAQGAEDSDVLPHLSYFLILGAKIRGLPYCLARRDSSEARRG